MQETESARGVMPQYRCERCGYVYRRQADYHPYLCIRCMRFIAKRTYMTMVTITPPARTVRDDL